MNKNILLLFILCFTKNVLTMGEEKATTQAKLENTLKAMLPCDNTISPERITTFLQVKKILTITKNISAELQEKYGPTLENVCCLPEIDTVVPNPFWIQNQEGIRLFCLRCPYNLTTPWGNINIFEPCKGSTNLPLAHAIKLLFQRLTVSFIGCSETTLNTNFWEIISHSNGTLFSIKLNEEEVAKAKGTNRIIVSGLCGQLSMYDVTEVDRIPCPRVAEVQSFEDFLANEKPSKMEWEILENAFQRLQA